MKAKYFSLVFVAIIFSMVIIAPSVMTQTADAAKAAGVKNQQYGQATSNKVCGDRLCTAEDFTKEGTKKEITPSGKSSINSNIAMSKMERLFELHRMQLLSAWDSISDSEKSHMLKMFDNMYEKMQSMSFSDHMKHMSKMMMDDKHHAEFVQVLFPLISTLILTQPHMNRAVTVEGLKQVVPSGEVEIATVDDSWEAYCQAHRIARSSDLICVTGSLFLVGEILHHLTQQSFPMGTDENV